MLNVYDDKPYLVKERNLIMLPAVDRFAQIVSKTAKLMVVKGVPFYVVKNAPRINSQLRNMGEPVASPIYFSDFDWSDIKIFSAQAEMAGLLVAHERCYNLSDMGVGKTIGSLLAVDWLIKEKYITHALVVAPLAILRLIWFNEIMKRFKRLRPIILHGPKEKRLLMLNQRDWNVAIINHDGIKVIPDELISFGFGMIIIDELAAFRDVRTARWKILKQIVHPAPFAAGLTGSPCPNLPSDCYGQSKLLTPHRVPMPFRAFRSMLEIEVRQNRWVPKPDAMNKVYNVLQPAIRFKRSDVIELKDRTSITREVELSPQQVECIEALRKDAIARYPAGVVTGTNAAVLLGKMLQAHSGAVYTSEKNIIDLKPEHRYQMLESIIDEAAGKVIVCAPFVHITDMLVKRLSKYNARLVNGTVVNQKKRDEIFSDFNDPNDPMRVLVAHPEVMAHGLNLTAANILVWFSPMHSRRLYEQANGRITRLGQKREQLIVHLSVGKIEQAVYNVLENKGKMQDAILAIFEEHTSAGR